MEAVDPKSNALVLLDQAKGETFSLRLLPNGKAAKSLIAFETGTRDIAEGDHVRFKITDKIAGIANGARGVVGEIDQDYVRIRLDDGRQHTIARDSLAAKGIDHAYALTTHGYQGSTVDRIIVAMSSQEQLANQKSFYVAISRARDEARLVTDDAEALLKRLERDTGLRPSALEAHVETALQKAKEAQAAERDRIDDNSKDGLSSTSKSQDAKTPKDLNEEEGKAEAFFMDIERDIQRLRERGQRTR